MRINQRKIKRRKEQILISNSQENRAIDRRIALKHLIRRLVSPALVLARDLERSVSEIELSEPGDEFLLLGGSSGDVAVVGADGHAGVFPLEEDFAAGEGEGLGPVAGDAGGAFVAYGGVAYAGLGIGESGVAGVGDAGADELHWLCVVGRNPG